MMDRLEKSSGQTVITLNEAKSLLKQDNDYIIAVYDYWLNKRLKMVRFLISVKLHIVLFLSKVSCLLCSAQPVNSPSEDGKVWRNWFQWQSVHSF